jgi:ethanolamine ammonia-lyase small subunit
MSFVSQSAPVPAPTPAPTPLSSATPVPDPWAALRKHTAARIAIGRAGGSQRTASLLDFRLAHARARDAVLAPLDTAALCARLAADGFATELLHTAAGGRRETHLARPDLGRRLAPASREHLTANAPRWGQRDLAIVLSDGLSALAVARHAPLVLAPLAARLAAAGWTLYPVFVVPFGRVKLQDEIGELLGARLTLMLLGERPGLDSPDSLGAYFTHAPGAARTDADRNCVSNIRPEGLPPAAAAETLARLLLLSLRLGLGGVALKDNAVPADGAAALAAESPP